MDRLAEGAGSLVLVEGPAGIGKTRLLYEAAEFGRGRRFLVRSARGGELERELPFGVVRQLLEPLVERSSEEDRARLLSGSARLALIALGRADPARSSALGDPFAPIHGLYWLLANLAESQPVLIDIDDAQWADAQTLRFLEYLARRVGDLPVLVLASMRTGEPDEPAELERLRLQAELLRPSSLSSAAVRELIASELHAAPSADFAEACTRATAGNPFLISELLRAVRADSIKIGGDAAATLGELAPETVARYVLVRLGRFGKDAIALAHAISVLGGSPQLRHAAKLAGLEEERCQALCDRLRQGEILTPGVPIDFVHPLVRQAIYHELSEGERSRLHRRAAQILYETGASAREAAPHLMECAPNGDQWIVARLGEAAFDAIESGAPEGATSYLQRALEEPPDDDLPILYGLGRSVLGTDARRAGALLSDVAERSQDGRTRKSALRHATYAYIVAGDWEEAASRLTRLIELVPEEDREQRLVVEAQLFHVSIGTGLTQMDWERISTAAAASGPRSPGGCLVRQAMAHGRFIEVAPVDQVIEFASTFPPPSWHAKTLVPGGAYMVLAWCGRWEDARRGTDALLEEAGRSGVLATLAYGYGVSATVELAAGRLADAEAEARTAWEILGAVAPDSDPGRGAAVNLLTALIANGDFEGAKRLAAPLDLSGGVAEHRFPPWPLEVRGYLRLACGDLDAGVQDLLEFGDGAERFGYLNPAVSAWRQAVAPALAALGRTTEAGQLIVVAEERARAFGAAHVLGTVLRSRALLEPRSAQIATLEESVAALGTYGPPHELARSLVELGAALRRDGRRKEAREPLRRGLDISHRCAADGLAQRAREELAATGARPRREMITGRDALTATEQRIAAMAASGMSNRAIAQSLFVTRKNVENHLGRVYGKLGISSRTELAEALGSGAPSVANLRGGSP